MACPPHRDNKMNSQRVSVYYATDDDVVNIMTLYPPWSPETNDTCDINQIADDRSIKEIQDKLYKDTPVKTEINKTYIDNIDAYNRDRALITKCFRPRSA